MIRRPYLHTHTHLRIVAGICDPGSLEGSWDRQRHSINFPSLPGLDKNYDVALKRLKVHSSDNWKGIIPPQNNPAAVQLPPIYSAKFCGQSGYQQFLALADEDGKVCTGQLVKEGHPITYPLSSRWLFWTLTETPEQN